MRIELSNEQLTLISSVLDDRDRQLSTYIYKCLDVRNTAAIFSETYNASNDLIFRYEKERAFIKTLMDHIKGTYYATENGYVLKDN